MADVLKVEGSARVRLSKNGVKIYDQLHAPNAEAYTEHTADRIVLATNMAASSALNMGGVATGQWMLLETDNTVLVSLSGTTTQWTVSKALFYVGSFTSLYLQNESTTNQATVTVLITD